MFAAGLFLFAGEEASCLALFLFVYALGMRRALASVAAGERERRLA